MKSRVAGHFGEWIQGRFGPSGSVVLVTVPCPELYVEVERISDGQLAVQQYADLLEPKRARMLLNHVGGLAGKYRLTGNISPGVGAGASTAALIALARAAEGDETLLAHACIQCEGASDPLMFDAPDRVLWASREGRVLSDLPKLPSAEIVGGSWGSPLATDANDNAFPDVLDLATRLQDTVSLAELAEISTESAARCQHLRGPDGDPTLDLIQELDALGCLRAHTGSARGFIFRPGEAPKDADVILRSAGYSGVMKFQTE